LKLSRTFRGLLTSAALCAAVALAGCDTDGLQYGKAMKSLSPEMIATLQQKNMPTESPILVRLFKEDAELEVWKAGRERPLRSPQDLSDLSLVRRAWAKDQGRRPAGAEGFYTITPAQMNPKLAVLSVVQHGLSERLR